jgi:Spy/CpxP family protein refolding chaperone
VSASKTTFIATVVVVLTFVAGMVTGVFASHMMILRGSHGAGYFPNRALVNRLDRHLDLTDAQRAQVEQIIRRRHQRIDQLWSETRPRVNAEISRTNAEISAILTPEQNAKFEKLKMRFHRRK